VTRREHAAPHVRARQTAALVLGAGWGLLAGLPLTRDLFRPGPELWTGHTAQAVKSAYAEWKAAHPELTAEHFIFAAYEGALHRTVHRPPLRGSSEHGQLVLDLDRPPERERVYWSQVVEHLQVRLSWPLAHPRSHSALRYRPLLLRRTPSATQEAFWAATLQRFRVGGVVTTNYDVSTEQTLGVAAGARPGSPGFRYAGLNVACHPVTSPFGRDRAANPQPRGAVELAKLHGSLNWSLHDGRVAIYPDLRPAFRNRGDAAIIPPLPEKAIPRWLWPVWRRATDLLANVDVWLIVGYSLPQYDFEVHRLFEQAAQGRVRRILIFDPNSEELVHHFQNIASDAVVEARPGLPAGSDQLIVGRHRNRVSRLPGDFDLDTGAQPRSRGIGLGSYERTPVLA
jgi:hypothetical protein